MIKPVGGPEPRTQGFNPTMPRGNPVGPAPRGGMAPIMGTFHQGGTVPEDGAYKMKKGEKVLTEAQTSHLKHSFGLAQAHLAHDAAPQVEHKMPRKKIKSVHVRRTKNGSYVMKHEHHAPHHMQEHDEEHAVESKDSMLKHMAAEQNQPEAPPEPEEMGESAGTQQMEQAIGMK